MAEWVIPGVRAFMPPDLAAACLLIDAELIDEEISALLASAVSDFRLAFNAASDPVGSLDEHTVPDTVVPRVRALVWYPLALELGVDPTNLRPSWQDAEIYLRQLLREVSSGSGVSSVVGTPHYSSGPAQGFVRLSGASAPVIRPSPVIPGGINYGPPPMSTMV